MRKMWCSMLLLLLAYGASAQIIKKQARIRHTRLDSVYLDNTHYRMETLDSVYRYLAAQFHVQITYDTAYALRHYHDYWYLHTPLSRVIEITTRDQRLTYKIDSAGAVTIKRRGKLTAEDTITERPPVQVKYEGKPRQTHFTLSGKIIDFVTGDHLGYANLMVMGSQQMFTSDASGFFTIPDVATDTVTVTVSLVGYELKQVYLNPNIQTNNFLIELMPSAQNNLKEVVVTAAHMEVLQNSQDQISMIKMTPTKLSLLPNVGEKDIMRAMQLMPGVSAANESSSGLYVRGGTPDQNLVLYDGYTIYHVDHLYGFFSAFNSNALKDMQLYKGGFDAVYGGRLSSITDITGKEANKRKFNLGGDISLLSGNIFTEIPVSEKISVSAAVRRSWKGPIYNWIFNKVSGTNSDESTTGPGGATTETKSYFFDLNTKVTYRASPKDHITYSYFSSVDRLNKEQSFSFPGGGGGFGGSGGPGPRSNGSTDFATYNNRGMSIQWERKWNKKLTSNTTASYSNYFSNRDRTNERSSTDETTEEVTTVKTGVIEDNNLKDLSAKTQFDWDAIKHNRISFGAFGSYYDIKYSYSENDTSTILNRKNYGGLSGAFLQNRFRFLKDRGELKAGVRLSYYDVTSKTYTEPRLSASYKITPRLSFKSAYGEFYQFVNQVTREDVLSGSTQFWTLSDSKNVPVSSATHYIAGLSYDTKGYTFSAEGYYKQLQDLTQYSMRFSSVFGSYKENFYSGQGYSQGVEFMVQKKSGNLTGWVSYTLAKAYNQFDIYGSNYFPANQDVTNEFKIVSIYKRGKWDYSATWIFATGRPYTAPGGSYQVTLLDGTVKDYFTVTSENSLRLPAYHRLDLSVNRHLFNEKNNDIGYIGFSIFNAYNHTNIWYKQFYISDSKITEVDVNYLGFTPNLTLSLKIR